MSIHLFKHASRRATMVATGALAVTMLVSSCSDQPTEGGSASYNNPLALITGGATEVSLSNLDPTQVEGVAKVYLGKLNDDDVNYQDQTSTSLWAGFGLETGPVNVAYCRAEGNDVPEDAGSTIRSDGSYHTNITEGSDVRWETQWPDGVILDGKVQVPRIPEITNIAPYADVTASAGMTINTSNSVAGGEAIVTILYDDQRTRDKGLDLPAFSITDVPQPVVTYHDTQEDDGTLSISGEDLNALVKNKVYLLSVQRFRYVVRPTSLDGREVGIAAITEYTVPFTLR